MYILLQYRYLSTMWPKKKYLKTHFYKICEYDELNDFIQIIDCICVCIVCYYLNILSSVCRKPEVNLLFFLSFHCWSMVEFALENVRPIPFLSYIEKKYKKNGLSLLLSFHIFIQCMQLTQSAARCMQKTYFVSVVVQLVVYVRERTTNLVVNSCMQ